nr:MAG TPA: hypothetical protein [Caudoviricetes sp.]
MITWLIKSQNEYRVDTMVEVEEFHKYLQDKAADEGYTLSSFSWTEKQVRTKEEEYSYFQVKTTFTFNVLKDPENPFFKVEFPKVEIATPEAEDNEVDEEW